MANPYSPNGAVPGNQLGPMAMPGYSMNDIYGGMYPPANSQALGNALMGSNPASYGGLIDPGQSIGTQPNGQPIAMNRPSTNDPMLAYGNQAPTNPAVGAAGAVANAPPVDSGLSNVAPGTNPGGIQGLFTDGGLLSHGLLSGIVGNMLTPNPWGSQSGSPPNPNVAMNGQPIRANPNVNSFGMINTAGNHDQNFGPIAGHMPRDRGRGLAGISPVRSTNV